MIHLSFLSFRRSLAVRSGFATAVVAWILACGPESSAIWTGTVDTLPGGAVLVSNQEGMWHASQPWRLVEERRIGSRGGAGPEAFGVVSDLEVDSQGRIYVLDRQAQDVRVFEGDGSHIRTIGRAGRGPGEFSGVTGIGFDPAQRLWVMNQGNARYSVFDTGGNLLKEMPRRVGPAGVTEWVGVFDRQGALYDLIFFTSGTRLRFAYARYDTVAGRFVDTMPHVGFPKAPLFWGVRQATPNGWWLGTATAYKLYETTFTGDTVRVIERPYDPIPLEAPERDSLTRQLKQLSTAGPRVVDDVPTDHKPIFIRFIEDERRYLWVMLSTPAGEEGTHLDVFDPSGRYLGLVTTPLHLEKTPTPIVRHDRVYAMTKGDLDVPYVVTLRIEGRD